MMTTRLEQAEALLREASDRLDDMGDRDFGGDLDEEASRRVENYRKRVAEFLSGPSAAQRDRRRG